MLHTQVQHMFLITFNQGLGRGRNVGNEYFVSLVVVCAADINSAPKSTFDDDSKNTVNRTSKVVLS